MTPKTAYPLSWPVNWPRSKNPTFSRFRQPGYQRTTHSMAECTNAIGREIKLLGASGLIISTNVRLRQDGLPYSQQPQPKDTGAAVYFKINGKDTVLACDRWNRVECNLWAIAKHIEAIRGQDRLGVGSIEQAFRGYQALPERTAAKAWWDVLEVPSTADKEVIKDAYRRLAKQYHPDTGCGGSDVLMAELNSAYEQAMRG